MYWYCLSCYSYLHPTVANNQYIRVLRKFSDYDIIVASLNLTHLSAVKLWYSSNVLRPAHVEDNMIWHIRCEKSSWHV